MVCEREIISSYALSGAYSSAVDIDRLTLLQLDNKKLIIEQLSSSSQSKIF